MLQTKSIRLGVQTNAHLDLIEKTAFWKCQVWAKDYKAKSFSYTFYHTDYHGIESETITGYATINVTYYPSKNAGQFQVVSKTEQERLRKEFNELDFHKYYLPKEITQLTELKKEIVNNPALIETIDGNISRWNQLHAEYMQNHAEVS